jgi:hypothetical protein
MPSDDGERPCAAGRLTRLESYRRGGTLSVSLALALPLLRLSRTPARAEDNLGYRHEFYREDDDRIKVDTDSFLFDLGLQSNVRLSGNVVIDAISGATPLGAPPQTQWPFPTYANLYTSAYQQAYTSQYNLFVAENQIYVDSGYETYQQMTNMAAQFAQSSSPGIATNSANASYQSLTNNPNYRNNSVPLVHMHDRRTAASLGLPITLGLHELTPSIAYSTESDYVSWSGALNYSVALNNKNTTLSAGWAHDADNVRDDKFIWEDKTTDAFFLGVVQLLSPKSYLTINGSLSAEHGYLADPYRGVMAATNSLQLNPDDPALIPEKRPRHRTSELLFASWTQSVAPLDGSAELSYRLFHDSFGILAHTVECDWHQRIGKSLVVSPVFRYYLQSAADFYYVLVPDANALPAVYSSDYRLSHLESFAAGLNVTWRLHKNLSLDASYLRYVMRGLDGATSQSAYPSAHVLSLGARIWF